jgi:excisionase family DNA binding protein
MSVRAPTRLLRAADVAERLAISQKSVYRLAHQGELPSVHLTGRVVRFDEAEIEQWLEGRKAARSDGETTHR